MKCLPLLACLLPCLPACTLYGPPDDDAWLGEALVCDQELDTVAYRIDVIDTPANADEADALGWDLDGDGTIDNQGGNIISAIDNAIDVDLQGAVADALDSDLVQIGILVESCGEPDFALISLVRGVDIDRLQEPPAFSGETVTTFPSVVSEGFPLVATDGATRFPVGQLIHPVADEWIDATELVVVLDPQRTIDELTGHLVAGLDAEQAFTVVTRAFRAKIVERQEELGPCTPEACDDVLRTILGIFDTNEDGDVGLDEVRDNSLMQTLLRADLDLDGDGVAESYSAGVGFRASRVDLAL